MVEIKNQGRAGNFLFEMATAIAYAKKHGLEFTAPSSTNNIKWNPIYFSHLINPKYDKRLPTVEVHEVSHAFQQLPFSEQWRDWNIRLHGYFQSEKYFIDYRNEVLEAFNIPYTMNKGTVSIHVRRGDYLQLREKHPEVTIDWYYTAAKHFYELGYRKFLVFSDDIQWCKQNFIGYEFKFAEGNRELKDLELMANCEHNISSASTYSWWGNWLNRNPDKKIVIPRLWFVEGHGGLDVSDIVPSKWTKI